ncbi:histidine phosphatase family protein [Microvirga roseola]|uniref:histidine phosphatase family protein n=1 Tax=Microvirga roseola TaxID=2883126 RepID=UPI001E3C8B8E|nr:histidine phosphatase family protein [Microvirga roseola]
MRFALALTILAATALAQPLAASEAAWQALRDGGTVALLRHARAPGTGDPAGFKLEDCSTQRNLSEEGREQARQLGETFGDRQIPVTRVLSSRWCRSLDTARLAFGDRAEPYPPLDSFFRSRGDREAQTEAVRELVRGWSSEGVLVLVTHQVNITALTDVFPAEGEVIVLRPKAEDGFDLVGRIRM